MPVTVLSILTGLYNLILKITLKGRYFYYTHFTGGKLRVQRD